MTEPLLRLTDVNKSFVGTHAVQDVSLEIHGADLHDRGRPRGPRSALSQERL